MGSALIDVMRARFAPSRLSRSWSQALRPTEAETFARQVSLRWEQAAAELEELIRARVWEPALEDTAEMEDPGSAGASPARFDRGGAHPRAREAGPPRAEDPARRMRFSPVGESFPERPLWADPYRFIVAQGLEASSASGEPTGAAVPRARSARADEPLLEPGSLRGREEPGDPMPPLEPRGRPRSEAGEPSRGAPGAREGDGTARRVDRAPPGRALSDLDELIAVARGSPETTPGFPRRHGRGASDDPAAVRPGGGFPASGESPRHLRRAGGPGAPSGAAESPRRGTPPEPRLDLLIEEARRRADALEDWERTGF